MEQSSLFGPTEGHLKGLAGAATITGSRDIPEAMAVQAFETFLTPALAKDTTWYLGGARGVDTWALKWLIERQERCVVVVPFRVDDQPNEAKEHIPKAHLVIELKLPKSKAAFIKRNRFMVDHSRIVWGFWNGMKGGTFSTLQYALRNRKLMHVIPILPPSDVKMKVEKDVGAS